jgi:hypothetical protein
MSRIMHSQSNTIGCISPSMCFSTSVGIDNLAINGLVLQVEAFIVLLDHFILILLLQREANCKRENTYNSENTTKVY